MRLQVMNCFPEVDVKRHGWIEIVGGGCRSSCLRLKLGLFSLICAMSLASCSSGLDLESVGIYDLVTNLGPAQRVLSVVAMLAGFLLLVVGWKIYRLVVVLPGFLIGAVLGAWLGQRLSEYFSLIIIGLALGGLIGIWLAQVVHNFALFVIGAVGGVYILNSLWSLLLESSPPIYIVIISGIIGGIALLTLYKHWMVILSSAIGAVMFGWGIQGSVGLVVVLFLVGVVVQYSVLRSKGDSAFVRPDG